MAALALLGLTGCPPPGRLVRPEAGVEHTPAPRGDGRAQAPHGPSQAPPASGDGGPRGEGHLAQALSGPERLRVIFVDVGQGDSIILRTASGKTVLVDAGTKGGSRAVRRQLRALGVDHLDLAVMTHAHNDHIGGMVSILTSFPPRLFLDPGYHATSAVYQRLLEFLVAHEIPTKLARRGRRIDLGDGVRMTLLEPEEPLLRGTRSDANSNSVIARVTVGSFSLLLTGDAEEPSEGRLLAAGGELRSHVLKVAHHGGRYSTKNRFLNVVRPEIAVISVGARNRYGHPTEETLGRLARHRVKVFRTDLQGTITLRTDGQVWTVETERQPEGTPVGWGGPVAGEAAPQSPALRVLLLTRVTPTRPPPRGFGSGRARRAASSGPPSHVDGRSTWRGHASAPSRLSPVPDGTSCTSPRSAACSEVRLGFLHLGGVERCAPPCRRALDATRPRLRAQRLVSLPNRRLPRLGPRTWLRIGASVLDPGGGSGRTGLPDEPAQPPPARQRWAA